MVLESLSTQLVILGESEEVKNFLLDDGVLIY